MSCLICKNPISPFIDFGKMPIANGFLKEEEFGSEYFFNLSVAFCTNCHMVQLTEQPDRERMFHENYAFYSSTSKGMAVHFENFAKDVMNQYVPEFVVEIGSNDGIMLRHFTCRHLGIEPSKNVADVAHYSGITTINSFFSEKLAQSIVEHDGQADVILAANVMCHISDIHSVIAGIKNLLKQNGVLIFEDPYLGDILAKTSYDQIYDEHAFYFSLGSVRNMFAQHGMEVVDVEPQDVHGGSMRYTVANVGAHRVSERVGKLLAHEKELGFHLEETYQDFRLNVEMSRVELMKMLHRLKDAGYRVAGYGATSKSTTITNYCGITPDLLPAIYDTTPIKQGKFSPGAHIPIRPYEEFNPNKFDYALLFAWNHATEIMSKESEFCGKWITYVPEVKVI